MLLIINTSNIISDERYVSPLLDILPEGVLVKHFLEVEDIPKNIHKIIITGNSIFSTNLSLREIKSKFKWIDTFDKPVLGICAGQQILAQYFGSRLDRNDSRGLKEFLIKRINPVLKGVKPGFYGYVSHNFSAPCPKDFKVLAKSNSEYIAKHNKKDIYISSFHPEFSEKQILENFVEL